MPPPGQQQLRALFQPHRLVTHHRDGAGTSVAARQQLARQGGQSAIAHVTRHADVGITCRSSTDGGQQVCRAAGERSADAVRLRSREGVAAALHGAGTIRHIHIGAKGAVRGIQRAVVVDIARHRHAAQYRNAAGSHLRAITIPHIQRTARHLQLAAGVDIEEVLPDDIGILQLQFAVLVDIDIGRVRNR